MIIYMCVLHLYTESSWGTMRAPINYFGLRDVLPITCDAWIRQDVPPQPLSWPEMKPATQRSQWGGRAGYSSGTPRNERD